MLALDAAHDVTRVHLWTRTSRLLGYTVSAWLTRGILVDTGFPHAAAHVRDVARANVLALTADTGPGALTAYNVASGTPHTIGEVAAALALGGPDPVVTGEYRLGDVRHVVASPERARAGLGFSAQVPFEEGMAEFATAPLRGAGA